MAVSQFVKRTVSIDPIDIDLRERRTLELHNDRGNLMRFLEQPFVEPTNNRAERILRPAVIARKVSQCSKNQEGAEAFAAFKSIAQTAVKSGVASVTSVFRTLFASANA